MSVGYHCVSTTISSLTFHDSTMDIGDHNVGAFGIVLELGNDGMGFCNSDMGFGNGGMSFGNSDMCIYRKLGLEIRS